MSAQNAEALSEEIAPTGRPRTTFVGFLVPVLAVALVGSGVLFLYAKHEREQKQIAELIVGANDLAQKHNLASLKQAAAQYGEALKLDDANPYALTGLAWTDYAEWQHGAAGKLAEARATLTKAKDAGADNAKLYATEGLVLTAEGKAAEADALVRSKLKEGFAVPSMVYALGVSLAAQGKLLEANQRLRQASEGDFTEVAFNFDLAKVAMLQGQPRAAIKDLSAVIGPNMSPNHALAKAWRAALLLREVGSLTSPLRLITEAKAVKDKGPRTEGMILWAEGETALAVGNAAVAIEKADAALKLLPKYPPLFELKARAYRAMGKPAEAMAALGEAVNADPRYRGLRWKLAEAKSAQKDDDALSILAKLEDSHEGTKAAEYELFKGEHYLRQGKLDEAKKHFEAAAERGDDGEILLGLAKVTFEQEKAKGKKADIGKVSEALETALSHQRIFPEAQEYLGEVSLWNYMVPAANGAYETAERQFKQLRKPTPELVRFYDRVIASYEDAKAPQVRRQTKKLIADWKKKKQDYLASLLSGVR